MQVGDEYNRRDCTETVRVGLNEGRGRGCIERFLGPTPSPNDFAGSVSKQPSWPCEDDR